MDGIPLYHEYRLIERNEADVNEAWKGAHLLLLFLAFIFGSFCTFCFHMLTYMFDENCVLFPKIVSMVAQKHSIIYDIMPMEDNNPDVMAVDFLNTQWSDQSVCYLPKYMPLVSSICGLIWTTMFLMCSTGSQISGLQRPWRLLPYVFVFSLIMGCICIYSSAVTHSGLSALCSRLGEVTGSESCSYSINVVTLVYERRVRDLFQAIYLTIATAWLHTLCWLLSAVLVIVRVILAVDFQLIRVSVELLGNVEKMLEHHEKHIRSVSPDSLAKDNEGSGTPTRSPHVRVHFRNKSFNTLEDRNELLTEETMAIPPIWHRGKVNPEHKFIVDILYDLLNIMEIAGYFDEVDKAVLKKSKIETAVNTDTEDIKDIFFSDRNQRLSDPQSVMDNLDLPKSELLAHQRSLEVDLKRRIERFLSGFSRQNMETQIPERRLSSDNLPQQIDVGTTTEMVEDHAEQMEARSSQAAAKRSPKTKKADKEVEARKEKED